MLSIQFKETSFNNELKLQNELLTVSKEINTPEGFLESYFKILPFFKSKEDAFLYVDILHYKKYNSFKYNSYKKFKKERFK
jgi:hypothetical protein